MSAGQGCICNAYYSGECLCAGVDWRSSREVELEAEIIRLRDLLDRKVGSSIRVELPGKDNGWKCWVTCQREKDEERIANILAESLKMLCELSVEISKRETDIDRLRAKNRIYKNEITQMNKAILGYSRALSNALSRNQILNDTLASRSFLSAEECDEILSTGLAEVVEP